MQKNEEFDQGFIDKLVFEVCQEFMCERSDIYGLTDSIFKKTVVFVLFKFYKYNKRQIGNNFRINYLYVPTASDEMEYLLFTVNGYRSKIISILKKIGYEGNVEHRNALCVA